MGRSPASTVKLLCLNHRQDGDDSSLGIERLVVTYRYLALKEYKESAKLDLNQRQRGRQLA